VIPKITLTASEFAVGTPGYMCPEQARGEDMDHRGDLYSVGVILFELLTGQLPFVGGATMDILLAHATMEPPSFAAVGGAAGVPPAIERVVQTCMAKDPLQRPRHARELAQMYEDAISAHLARTPSPSITPGPRPRSNPWVAQPQQVSLRDPVATAPEPPGYPVPTSATPTPSGSDVLVVRSNQPAPVADPLAIVHHLEAWMPERIASCKLRGFIHDVVGELVESVPGRIRVRLGGKGCAYSAPSRGISSWLGLGRKANLIDVEMRLQASSREHQLRMMVIFRSGNGESPTDLGWRQLCSQIFCDLRAYLMGQSEPLNDTVS
jgi:serine/threonine-protein kinase